ncbi:MAG: metal-sensing transcriptional repressor [Roseburia sp.]|nr:metal-sensing transcriptional repressor [Roseburia sp.]
MDTIKNEITESAEKAEFTEEAETCCSGKKKQRTDKEYKDLMNRLKRIEGQVRGIQGMLERGAYCPDILVQVAAVNAALNSFNKVLLTEHLKTCVVDNIRQGNDEVVDELVQTLKKMMK